jgi:hypothetical protein
MARKPTVAQAIESTTAQAFEAVEQDAPEGVIEAAIGVRPDDAEPGEQIDGQGLPPAIESDLLDVEIYMVQWHIKTNGRRYGPGDDVALTEQQAAPFLASGAIEKA